MPTIVLDLDVGALPPRLVGLARYDSALALLRWRGRPVGQAFFALSGSEIEEEALRAKLLQHAGTSFWEAWLRDQLGIEEPQSAAGPGLTVTVAVCTRDRTQDLERCLLALAAMPQDGQRVIVIDNAPSTDATRRLVERLPEVTYILEPKAGLDVARNRALREAKTDIVAFTDDDAKPDEMWLRTLLGNFGDPLVLASTGLTMALELEHEAQVKFQSYGGFTRGFKKTVFDGGRHEPLLGWHAGAGVNMAVRRSLVELVGEFDEALDAGTATRAGGDSDMFRRILAAGYRVVYDPTAVCWHCHRRTEAELASQLVGYEVAGGAILGKALWREGNLSVMRHGWRTVRSRLRGIAIAALGRSGPSLLAHWKALCGFLSGPLTYLRTSAPPERR
jgi:GT2 family glycosyltransferase